MISFCQLWWDVSSQKQKTNMNSHLTLLPFVSAVVSIKPSEIQGRAFDYIVITRRSCLRAGTRYNTRGVDIEGNVGNFNETEQIVIDSQGNTTSYIQTRGFVFFFLRFYFFVLEIKQNNAKQIFILQSR